MKTIWKYRLECGEDSVFTMPAGAELLAAQAQQGVPVLWALVDTDKPNESRKVACWGTGWNPIDIKGRYLGTVQDAGGFVWHYFDEQEAP